MVYPLTFFFQLRQQLRRRAVIVEARTAAGSGRHRKIDIGQCLRQRGEMQGILRMTPLVQSLPGTKLEITNIDDFVTSGYLPIAKKLE